MRVKQMQDLDLKGKYVLIRQDLNVPIQDGEITSDIRIQASVPTIKQAVAAGARVMLMSHLGRPTEGKFEDEFSLAPVAARLSKLLGKDVPVVSQWQDGVSLDDGAVVLLENVRFNPGEKKNDDTLAKAANRC